MGVEKVDGEYGVDKEWSIGDSDISFVFQVYEEEPEGIV